MLLVWQGLVYGVVAVVIILLLTVIFLAWCVKNFKIDRSEDQVKYQKLLGKYNKNVSEKNKEISDLKTENWDLSKSVQFVWNIVKWNRHYKKFSWKGWEIGLITAGIIKELEDEIKSFSITLENRDKKINAQKSVIYRRDKRIKNLLSPKKKAKKCQKK